MSPVSSAAPQVLASTGHKHAEYCIKRMHLNRIDHLTGQKTSLHRRRRAHLLAAAAGMLAAGCAGVVFPFCRGRATVWALALWAAASPLAGAVAVGLGHFLGVENLVRCSLLFAFSLCLFSLPFGFLPPPAGG